MRILCDLYVDINAHEKQYPLIDSDARNTRICLYDINLSNKK